MYFIERINVHLLRPTISICGNFISLFTPGTWLDTVHIFLNIWDGQNINTIMALESISTGLIRSIRCNLGRNSSILLSVKDITGFEFSFLADQVWFLCNGLNLWDYKETKDLYILISYIGWEDCQGFLYLIGYL